MAVMPRQKEQQRHLPDIEHPDQHIGRGIAPGIFHMPRIAVEQPGGVEQDTAPNSVAAISAT
jgi:hypothetical protein